MMGVLRSVRDLALEQTAVNWLAGQAMNLVPDLARAIVFLAGAIWVIQGRWQLGQLLAFQSYLGYRVWPGGFAGGALAAIPERIDRAGARLSFVRDLA